MIRRVLSRLALLVLLGVLLTFAWLLGSESGARVAIAYASGIVPHFSMRHEAGSLLGPLRLRNIVFKSPNMRTEIDHAQIDWSPTCLLMGEICLRELHINEITVTLPPAPPLDAAPVAKRHLPAITLPMTLDVGQLSIESFQLTRNGKTTHLTKLETAIAWQDGEMRIDRLVVGMPNWEARATGTLNTQGDWPLTARLSFVTPRSAAATFSLQGVANGSLADTHLVLKSSGLVVADLDGHLQPLQPGVPFAATATIPDFRIPPHGIPEKSAQLNAVTLQGHGQLLGQILLEGQGQLDTPWTPALPAQLRNAHGTWRGLDHLELVINDPRLFATVVSDYRWLDGQHFRAVVDIGTLDLALVNKSLPSQLAGKLQVNGAIDRNGTVIDVAVDELDGTLRQWPLASRGQLHWRDAAWHFDPLRIDIGDNHFTVLGMLDDAWHAGATLELNDIQLLQPAFAGRAGGSAKISGAPTDPSFTFMLAAQDLLLPAVTLPAPPARRVRLPASDWQIGGVATLRDVVLGNARTVSTSPDIAMSATGKVSWDGPLRWDLKTVIQHLSLHELLPELAGDVGGTFDTRGVLASTLETLEVDTRLQGTALDLPLDVDTRFRYSPERIDIDHMTVAHGDNHATLAGTIDSESNGSGAIALAIDIDAPDIASSLYEAGGAANVKAHITGTRTRPDIDLQANAQALVWRDIHVGSLHADAGIRDGAFATSTFLLDIENLVQGNQVVQSLAVKADGKRSAHTLDLQAQADPFAAHIVLSGSARGDSRDNFGWQGLLNQGDITVDDWHWTSVGAPALAFASNSATLDPHCWTDGSARACLTAQAVLGDSGHLEGEFFHLPLSALLARWLPVDTRIDGQVGGIAALAWERGNLSSLNADIRNANVIHLSLAGDDEQRSLGTIEQLQLNGTLDAQGGQLNGKLQGERVGTITAAATLGSGNSDTLLQRTLLGNLQIRDIQMDLLEAFTYQLRDIGGTLGGSMDVRGTLAHPLMTGQIALADGRTGFTRLPLNLVDINVAGRFDGKQISFDGSFRTPESAAGAIARIDGNVMVSGGEWTGNGTLKGDQLVIAALPEYQFTVVPDLALSANANEFGLDGTVHVPAGHIELKSLPAQSVKRSRDVIVVREQQVIVDSGVRFRQRIDVDFVLGDDVQFHAFGGDGRLAGDLRVRSTPDLPLLVNGELHIHDGKYAAFGQTLTLKQADLIFNGPADQPLIDALASRSFGDGAVREVGLRLSGSLRAPQTTLWSIPTLPDEEALSWLATGRPLSDGPINLRGEAAQAALSLGVAQGSALLTSAGQEIGLRDVQLATGGDGENAEVQVGTNLNERVFVGYNRRVFTGDESVLLRLHLTRRLMLEALSGLDSALDIFYTFEF